MTIEIARLLERAVLLDGRPSSDYDLNRDVALPEDRVLKEGAVLVGVTASGQVLLTKRAAHLKNHPGQIAFPGGRKDDGDTDLVAAALREAEEEVGLPVSACRVLGTLPPHETVTRYSVTPVIALIEGEPRLRPEEGEVAEIFHVPFAHVTDPARFRVEGRRWQGRRRHYYTVPYGPYYIWGATARILRSLADRVTHAAGTAN